MPEGGVGVGGGDSSGWGVELADVLGEIPAVCVPCAVDLDGQRTRSDRLRRVPRNVPQGRVGGAGEIQRGDLQVAPVNIALMQRYATVDCHLFVGAAALSVVRTFHHGVALAVGEAHGAILRVVEGGPNTGFCLDERLIAVCIKLRDEGVGTILGDGGVLVECIRCILYAACHVGALFESGGAVAYIVVGVLIVLAIT